jgi:hypothetical protein
VGPIDSIVQSRLPQKAGIWLGLHNEDHGFRMIDGQLQYEVFLNHTDPSITHHQFDTGNAALAVVDPLGDALGLWVDTGIGTSRFT